MNLVEVALQLLSLRLHYLGDRKSVLAAFACQLMTLSKTVLYQVRHDPE